MRIDPIPVIGHTPPYLLGRILLGLYFLMPGIMKIVDFEGSTTYMTTHGVPLVIPLLIITIALQVGGALALIIGYQTRLTALALALLVIVINLFMHDFWNSYEHTTTAHELQNFIKNLGIMAGLLVLAGANPPDKKSPA